MWGSDRLLFRPWVVDHPELDEQAEFVGSDPLSKLPSKCMMVTTHSFTRRPVGDRPAYPPVSVPWKVDLSTTASAVTINSTRPATERRLFVIRSGHQGLQITLSCRQKDASGP